MRDNKSQLFINISVESTNNKEDSPYPKLHQEEQVQSATKKVKFDSTCTEKFERSNTLNQDFVVGRDMNLAKQISIENFGIHYKGNYSRVSHGSDPLRQTWGTSI
jgi:hypothetical protein